MSGFLAFSNQIPRSAFKSATTSDGARILITPADENVGALALSVSGVPSVSLSDVVRLESDGDVGIAGYIHSLDNGANWRGRQGDTLWDNAAGGGAGTSKTILADTAAVRVSKPCGYYSSSAGKLVRVYVAVLRSSTTPRQIDVLYTTDMTGAGSWTTCATDITDAGGTGYEPDLATGVAMVFHKTPRLSPYLRCFYISGSAVRVASAYVSGSTTDLTWTDYIVASSVEGAWRSVDALVLRSGKVAAFYMDTSGGYRGVFCKTSSTGATWSVANGVSGGGTLHYDDATVVQERDGKIICFHAQETVQGTHDAIIARQTEGADPATGTWATYSETLWGGSANHGYPSATIAPDGTIYVVWANSNNGRLEFSKFKDGDANYSALATAHDPTETPSWPAVENIGGALWCAYVDTTNHDVKMVVTKYWVAGGSPSASWTSSADYDAPSRVLQFIRDDFWMLFSGSDGRTEDEWSITSAHRYGADRIFALTPSQPTKSTADNADWSAIYNLSALRAYPFDTICAIANVENMKVQLCSADDWDGTPTLTSDTELSFVQETVASGARTIFGYTVTRTSGTWTPHALIGKHAKLGTGIPALIVENTATVLYLSADQTSGSGDLKILSGRAWNTQTMAHDGYLRIYIPSQQVYDNKYIVSALLLGYRTDFTTYQRNTSTSLILPTRDILAPDGAARRYAITQRTRRSGTIVIVKPSAAQYAQKVASFIRNNERPIAFIPDDTNKQDWMLVYPGQTTEWKSRQSSLTFTEVV